MRPNGEHSRPTMRYEHSLAAIRITELNLMGSNLWLAREGRVAIARNKVIFNKGFVWCKFSTKVHLNCAPMLAGRKQIASRAFSLQTMPPVRRPLSTQEARNGAAPLHTWTARLQAWIGRRPERRRIRPGLVDAIA